MDYSAITFTLDDHVALITLNRPESANAMNLEMAKELMHAAIRCEAPDVKAVVLTGAGNVFSVGGDLKSFSRQESQLSAHIKEVTTYLNAAVSRFSRMDAPVIAAVNGVAAGGGMSLAISCDLVLAAESARFTMAYTKVGLTPDISGSYHLPRLVGLRRAIELTLTNRVLTAQEAYELGIVTTVVSGENVVDHAKALARELASGATSAIGEAKRLLYNGWSESLETQMEKESQAIARMAESIQGQEGIAAFLEKRPPRF